MKKFFASVLAALITISFGAATAFAATPQQHKALDLLQSLDTWMHADNDSGIAYINDAFTSAKEKAGAWHKDIWLNQFSLDYKPNDHLTCEFTIAAINVYDKLSKTVCPQQNEEITATEIVTADRPAPIFNISMRLRDLVPALKANKTFADLLAGGSLGGDNADISAVFALHKNSAGTAIWEITFTDKQSGKVLIVQTTAETRTPAFNFLTGK